MSIQTNIKFKNIVYGEFRHFFRTGNQSYAISDIEFKKNINKYLPQLIWNLCMKYILVKIKIKRYGYESHTNVDI